MAGITIDGKSIRAASDATILQVARANRIDIPTLCHLDGLSDVAACRLCLVEIAGSPKLQPACVTPVADGMVVKTDTPQLRDYRRTIVEMFFAERNHVCSVCVSNGHCELQDLAVATGMDHVDLKYQFPSLTIDASHDSFAIDHNRCILCTRCVRVCDEIEGAHTWDVAGRGFHSRVVTDFHQPWGDSTTCTSCGKCVQACPTGALFHRGSTVGEMEKDRRVISFLATAREDHQWQSRD